MKITLTNLRKENEGNVLTMLLQTPFPLFWTRKIHMDMFQFFSLFCLAQLLPMSCVIENSDENLLQNIFCWLIFTNHAANDKQNDFI